MCVHVPLQIYLDDSIGICIYLKRLKTVETIVNMHMVKYKTLGAGVIVWGRLGSGPDPAGTSWAGSAFWLSGRNVSVRMNGYLPYI